MVRDSIRSGCGALLAAGAVGTAALGLGAARRRRFDRDVQARTGALEAGHSEGVAGRFNASDVADLPPPVRRYFEHVLPEDQPYVQSARLSQHGAFRLGGADSRWLPLGATQQFSTDPPGFLWDARIDLLPGLPVRVVDAYESGEGTLDARILGVVPVAAAGPSAEMNQSELVRYLAEAVWFPTALLPAQGVTWEAVDDSTARAAIEDGDVRASLDFHFDERDRVASVTTERYRQDIGSAAPWTGRYGSYVRRGGLLVPRTGSVAWSTPEGEEPYWRATISSVDYRTGEQVASE